MCTSTLPPACRFGLRSLPCILRLLGAEVEVLVEVEKEVGIDHAEVERMQRELEREAEEQRMALLSSQELDRETALKLESQLSDLKQTIRNDRDAQIRAAHRLKQLQSKLVVGGENLLEKEDLQVKFLIFS